MSHQQTLRWKSQMVFQVRWLSSRLPYQCKGKFGKGFRWTCNFQRLERRCQKNDGLDLKFEFESLIFRAEIRFCSVQQILRHKICLQTDHVALSSTWYFLKCSPIAQNGLKILQIYWNKIFKTISFNLFFIEPERLTCKLIGFFYTNKHVLTENSQCSKRKFSKFL